MFDKGCAYSTINSVKCVIATIINTPPYSSINKHTLIKKYMTVILAQIKFHMGCRYFIKIF